MSPPSGKRPVPSLRQAWMITLEGMLYSPTETTRNSDQSPPNRKSQTSSPVPSAPKNPKALGARLAHESHVTLIHSKGHQCYPTSQNQRPRWGNWVGTPNTGPLGPRAARSNGLRVSRDLPSLFHHVRTPQEVYSPEDGLHQNPTMLPSSS